MGRKINYVAALGLASMVGLLYYNRPRDPALFGFEDLEINPKEYKVREVQIPNRSRKGFHWVLKVNALPDGLYTSSGPLELSDAITVDEEVIRLEKGDINNGYYIAPSDDGKYLTVNGMFAYEIDPWETYSEWKEYYRTVRPGPHYTEETSHGRYFSKTYKPFGFFLRFNPFWRKYLQKPVGNVMGDESKGIRDGTVILERIVEETGAD